VATCITERLLWSGYHKLPLRNFRFRVATDRYSGAVGRRLPRIEMRFAVTMGEAKQRSNSSKLSALCITSRSAILYPFGYGQFREARKIRACFIPRLLNGQNNRELFKESHRRRK
jgi:hypothetical protein